MAIHQHVNRLKCASGWSLAVIALTYVAVIAGVGAFTR